MFWVEKYRPKTIAQMVGNETARLKLYSWLKGWKPGSRPLMLLGPPGTGKTSAVHALADELGYSVIELNASDVRTEEAIKATLMPALTNLDLFGRQKLVFLDEIDGLFGQQDRGGLNAVMELIDKYNTLPMVMAANFKDDEKVKKLAKKCEVVYFKRVPPRLLELHLRRILKMEGKELPGELLKRVVVYSRGDVRSAINNLQYASLAPEQAELFFRDMTLGISEGLEQFFRARSPEMALRILSEIDANPEEKLRALFSSVVSADLDIGSKLSLLKLISDADLIFGRIKRRQEWRLLKYFYRLLSHLGVASPRPLNYSEADIPWSLRLRIWNDASGFKEANHKLAKFFHSSSKEVASTLLAYFLLIASAKGVLDRLMDRMDLSDVAKRVLEAEAKRIGGAR